MAGGGQDDVVRDDGRNVCAFLVSQHERIAALMSAVLARTGPAQEEAFSEFREALAGHEAAEEAILRPLTRRAPGGAHVADLRLAEEDRATATLRFLERLEVGSVSFMTQFRELQEAILTHAEHEETVEFPLLNRALPPEVLDEARVQVERAEAGLPAGPPDIAADQDDDGVFAALLRRARAVFSR